MIPGDGTPLFATSGGRWHHGFHQTPELPEILILGRERAYLSYFFRHFGASPDAIPADAVEEYERCYAAPGAMAAGLAYYRATAQDIADNEAAIDKGKLAMPVLALGGAEGMGRAELCCESMTRVAENVTGGAIPGAGHWLPEEVPDALAARLLDFFAEEP
jgi:pimeloyl-ACP methyl ester carboxylesterase